MCQYRMLIRNSSYGINSVGRTGDPHDLASVSREMADFVRLCIAGRVKDNIDSVTAADLLNRA
jgi:hypothetical protein